GGGFGSGGGAAGGVAGDLAEIARTYRGLDPEGRLADADLRERITMNKMRFQALHLTMARTDAAGGVSALASLIKVCAAEFAKERSELMIEAMAGQGLGWEGDAFAEWERLAARGWLRAKAHSIEGGTSEVNLNVIAKRVLGLPDPK